MALDQSPQPTVRNWDDETWTHIFNLSTVWISAFLFQASIAFSWFACFLPIPMLYACSPLRYFLFLLFSSIPLLETPHLLAGPFKFRAALDSAVHLHPFFPEWLFSHLWTTITQIGASISTWWPWLVIWSVVRYHGKSIEFSFKDLLTC